jgi:hypothetical protein
VVEVRDDNFPTVCRGERMQRVQQHHGIHAAGDGGQNGLAAREQTPLLDGQEDLLKEFGHAVSLLGFGTAGKRGKSGGKQTATTRIT